MIFRETTGKNYPNKSADNLICGTFEKTLGGSNRSIGLYSFNEHWKFKSFGFLKNQFECFEKKSIKESELSSQNFELRMNESGTNGTIQSVTIKHSSFRKIGKSQLLKNKF